MELRTSRLIMRPHAVEDFEPSARLWSEEEVVRHISGRPSTREESWSRVLRYIGHWSALRYGYWAVFEAATGRFAGEVGFADYHREIEPSLQGMPELGWVIAPHLQGRGYANEAVLAAIEWGERHLAAPRIACMIAPENAVSIRVAEKSGFVRTCETTYRGMPTLLFERPLAR